ncbi:hypothetical protein B0J11DRAFT_587352 [Dendryphion nanum]|uniref:Uncharacterized protein n=1 Tax=Dendryphion nanum TaxID=256645 RepID=A0A9P9IZU4_9PLEO|nr:hypothetical protein B0J11DRAFT_587352 [Dendryphion nanum]
MLVLRGRKTSCLAMLVMFILKCMASMNSTQSLLSSKSTSTGEFSHDLAEIIQKFRPSVLISDANDRFQRALAPLDTLCEHGDWIAIDVVKRLGLEHQIQLDIPAPKLRSGTGQVVESMGAIMLHWYWFPLGKKMHHSLFFVFNSPLPVDIIFGIESIAKFNLLSVNEGAFIPLMADQPSHKDDASRIKQAVDKANQDRIELNRRKAAKKSNGNNTGTGATA